MNTNSATVISIDEAKKAYQADAASVVPQDIHSGFSLRFNQLLDSVEGLPIPSARGRRSYVAKITGFSKPSVDEWLSKDKPPSDTNLRKIVQFLLGYIPGSFNIARVESWLRYGEAAVDNPFAKQQLEEHLTVLRPLAGKLIAQAARNLNKPVTSYSLQTVMANTIDMLADFSIHSESDCEPALQSMIEGLIIQHSK
jgi:hypothetical protein